MHIWAAADTVWRYLCHRVSVCLCVCYQDIGSAFVLTHDGPESARRKAMCLSCMHKHRHIHTHTPQIQQGEDGGGSTLECPVNDGLVSSGLSHTIFLFKGKHSVTVCLWCCFGLFFYLYVMCFFFFFFTHSAFCLTRQDVWLSYFPSLLD